MISEELERALTPAVSGELEASEPKEPTPSEDLDDNSTVVVRETILNEQSEPVLLVERPRRASEEPAPAASAAAPVDEIEDDSAIVVLETKKAPAPKRVSHDTVVGIGVVPAITRPRARVRDDLDEQSTDLQRARAEVDATRIDAHAAPPGDYTSTSEELLAAPPGPSPQRDSEIEIVPPMPQEGPPGPSGQIQFDRVQRAPSRSDEDEDDDDEGTKSKPTIVMSAVELDELVPGHRADVMPGHLERDADADADVDDDAVWGPPGTTIPPPLLGAMPGVAGQVSGVIPIPDVDTAPLLVAPPSAPERGVRPHSASETGIARALEEATAQVLELIRTLDHTSDRDQVIAVMIAHLADSHQRAGFFVTRGGELSLFAIMPRVPSMPIATLRLDRPSTLADVVGTRLPYRGPMLDEASRTFLASTLGACPPELLLVPIAVRERVVGVLFGDQRMRHTFDDQLALAARAAGMALERILKARLS